MITNRGAGAAGSRARRTWWPTKEARKHRKQRLELRREGPARIVSRFLCVRQFASSPWADERGLSCTYASRCDEKSKHDYTGDSFVAGKPSG